MVANALLGALGGYLLCNWVINHDYQSRETIPLRRFNDGMFVRSVRANACSRVLLYIPESFKEAGAVQEPKKQEAPQDVSFRGTTRTSRMNPESATVRHFTAGDLERTSGSAPKEKIPYVAPGEKHCVLNDEDTFFAEVCEEPGIDDGVLIISGEAKWLWIFRTPRNKPAQRTFEFRIPPGTYKHFWFGDYQF
jgi:hypothetical protein